MRLCPRLLPLLALSLALGLAACSPVPSLPLAPTQPPAATLTPEQVVQGFYDWYLGYELGNPLAIGAYRASEYLSPSFVAKVDDLQAASQRGSFDPFLCAQDLPDSIEVTEVVASEDAAYVLAQTSFRDHVLKVDLQRVQGEWLISNISQLQSPRAVVEGFYYWYLHYPGDPLVSGAYRSNRSLSDAFVMQVDIFAGRAAKGDPFTCSGQRPTGVQAEEAVQTGDAASVVVRAEPDGGALRIELRRRDGLWRINSATCLD